jgi:hypothetical protein
MELLKAIEGIDKYIEVIHKENQWSDPIRLSDSMLKLSVYNSYLSDHLAELHLESTQKRINSYMKNREDRVTQGDSKEISKKDSLKERTAHEKIKYKYNSTDKLIGTIQTKLKVIENQMKRELQNVT